MLNGKSDSAKESYFDGKVTRHNLYLGKDTFKRIDKKTKKVFGCAFYNVKKREHKSPQNIEVDTPLVS